MKMSGVPEKTRALALRTFSRRHFSTPRRPPTSAHPPVVGRNAPRRAAGAVTVRRDRALRDGHVGIGVAAHARAASTLSFCERLDRVETAIGRALLRRHHVRLRPQIGEVERRAEVHVDGVLVRGERVPSSSRRRMLCPMPSAKTGITYARVAPRATRPTPGCAGRNEVGIVAPCCAFPQDGGRAPCRCPRGSAPRCSAPAT